METEGLGHGEWMAEIRRWEAVRDHAVRMILALQTVADLSIVPLPVGPTRATRVRQFSELPAGTIDPATAPQERAPRLRKPRKRGIADAAAEVLRARRGGPMHAKDITERLRAMGLLASAKNDNSATSSVVSALQRDERRFTRGPGRNVWMLVEGGANAALPLDEPED